MFVPDVIHSVHWLCLVDCHPSTLKWCDWCCSRILVPVAGHAEMDDYIADTETGGGRFVLFGCGQLHIRPNSPSIQQSCPLNIKNSGDSYISYLQPDPPSILQL